MQANSRPVHSRQTGIHPHLAARVALHASTIFQKPVVAHNQRAFECSITAWQHAGRAPLILDAGCGVGSSSRHLAARFPDHFVIGVDQSADRLTRDVRWPHSHPENLFLVRAELSDYWRLLQQSGIALARHYLLYPNPWPKVGQLARRWHGHAVFPTVVALGGAFECRSNWRIYVEECAAALHQLTGCNVTAQPFVAAHAITPFEEKYRDSGHALWHCMLHLPS